ncbi:hypothetical protein K3727_22495 (plasmid) [Rhodobacteraceae bacterium M382]|nr:hypothetical protein K3727_22495 [Rhodobacteraceae bacterium M382]
MAFSLKHPKIITVATLLNRVPLTALKYVIRQIAGAFMLVTSCETQVGKGV